MENKLLKNSKFTISLVTIYILLLIGLVTTRLIENTNLNSSRSRTSTITSKSLRREAILTRMRKGSDYVQVNLLHFLFYKDNHNRNGIEKKIHEEVGKNDKNLQDYQKLIIDKKEYQLFNNLKATRVLYSKDREVLLKSIKKDNYDEAMAFSEHFLFNSFEDFQQANSNLSDYVEQRDNGDIEEIRNIYSDNERISLWLNIGIITILAILGIMITGAVIKSKATNVLLTESEKKYRTLVEESSEIISSADKSGKYIFSNKAFQNKLEYSEEEILNMHTDDILATESKLQLRPSPLEIGNNSVITGIRKTLQSKTGKKIIVEGNILLNYKKGFFDSAMAFFNDVTEKIMAEQALAISEDRYRQLFNLSPLPKWVIDPLTSCFTQVNQAAIDKYGYNEEEFLGMTMLDIMPLEATVQDKVVNPKQIELGLAFNGNFQHIKKSGEIMNVQIYNTSIFLNEVKKTLMVSVDITNELKYVNTIEIQNTAFREIAWIQSHVVRAPLSRLMGLIYLIKSETVKEEERDEALSYIYESAIELDAIIKDIINKISVNENLS